MASLMSRSSVSARVAARPARAAVRVNALMGNKWYPGATSPAHLDGSMAGDYGFDPLRLGVQKDTLKWYREAELTNGRWAMAAVVGILFTDLVGLPLFTEAGAQEYAFDTKTLAIVEAVVFAIVEGFRYNNIKNKGVGGFMTMAPFDPMGMNSKEMELKEIKNGRLAMLAFVGFCSQAAIYGKGPIECLSLHLADPGHNNIYTSPVGKETCVTVALLSVWPMIVEATKTLNKSGKEDTPSLFPWAEPWKQ